MNVLKKEPIVALSVLIAAVLAVVGIKVDATTLADFLFAGVPLIGGLLGRGFVTPNVKVPPVVEEVATKVEEVAQDVEKLAEAVNVAKPTDEAEKTPTVTSLPATTEPVSTDDIPF